MTMNDSELRLMALADGELDADEVRCVEQILETDVEARAMVAMFRETRSLLNAACGEGVYRNELEHRRTLRSVPTRPAKVCRRYAAMAAACLLTTLVGFGGGRWSALPGSARDAFLDEVAEYHEVFSRESLHLVEVSADRKTEFETWMGNRLGGKFEAPDLSSSSLHFAGGRMLVVDGKPVAEMMYTRDTGLPVALCITPMATGAEPLRVDERNGLHLASWTDSRYVFVVVGQLDPEAATDIAEASRAQMHL